MTSSIADIRKDYRLRSLTEQDADSPFQLFDRWWQEAITAQLDEVNAMTLATASLEGVPAARIVLLKGFSDKGFVFYSNYNSAKGAQLAENPRAALVFFWKELERQVRITGLVSQTSEEDSDAYFFSRPEGSRIGAWASPQSQVIASREWLEENELHYRERFEGSPITRPTHWGGYIVKPVTIEFWQGRASRLHDRLQFSLQDDGEWKLDRLAP
ncbi:MAG: pyridoxamine 5'-phosphate oxidase [Chitinophagaceae bacterium]|nr:MAG: pyridoxamine 5'-phosphate oxidase [Chitinophagaceae bacterium]